ncbi:hypothetical protein FS749_016174 [Ceratobasidium sp. UAMH 11750]|nr:hypothetical protein FS749_016174 [Ceratobasidium sp. UAMH 11750]
MADPSTPLKDLVAGRAVENHLIVAMTTLFIYDAVLTFSTEVKYVWFHQWNFGRIAFHFNRIWGLLITVITLPATFSHSTSRKTFVLSHFANSRRFTMLQVPGDINRRIWGIVLSPITFKIPLVDVMILRTWILYDKRKIIL